MRSVAAFALFAGLAMPALAAPVDDYKALRLAASLDDQCHVLKYVERRAIDEVAFKFIKQTTEYGAYDSGRMPREKYDAFLDGLDAASDATAVEIGCTSNAEAHLLMARGIASADIMQRLLLAYHFNSLPQDDYNRLPLDDDLVSGANGYQALLQQIYGEQFETFFEQQRQQAVARMPRAALLPLCDFLSPVDTECADEGTFFDPEVSRLMAAARQDSMLVRDVLLEVAAETSGFLFNTRFVQKYHLSATLIDAGGKHYGTLVDGNRSFRLEGGETVYGTLLEGANGQLRLVTYGKTAEKLRTGAVRLFIRSEPKPDGLDDWQVINLEDYRSLAFPFDGVLLQETCLGGPCFEFSPQATEAMLQTGFGESMEIWLSADAEMATPATRDWMMANTVRPQMLRRLRGETD